MARLGFSFVWLGLFWLGSFWFDLFPCLKKMAGKIPAGKKTVAERKTYRGKTCGKTT